MTSIQGVEGSEPSTSTGEVGESPTESSSKEDGTSLLYTLQQEKMTEELIQSIAKQPPYDMLWHSTSKLLKLKQEVSMTDRQLEEKKREVDRRLKATEERHKILEKKKETLAKRMIKFNAVIEEGKIVRYRALQRKSEEERELKIKEAKATQLKRELAFLKTKNKEILKTTQKYEVMEKYLEEVHDTAPTSYFDTCDSKGQSVINRMKALTTSGKQIHDELTVKSDEIVLMRNEMVQEKQEHQETMMLQYSKLSDLKKKYEKKKNENIEREQQLYQKLGKQRKKNEEMYQVLSAIDCLSDTCQRAMPATKVRVRSGTNPVYPKLKSIEAFVQHKTAVVNHVRLQMKEDMEGTCKGTETQKQTSEKSTCCSGDETETNRGSNASTPSINIL